MGRARTKATVSSGSGRVVRGKPAARIGLRAATLADARFLMHLRNDPVTRRSSFRTGPVAWADHRAWLAARLSDPRREVRLLVALFVRPGHAPVRMGQVRFDRKGTGRAEISLALSPRFRGRGLATPLLALALGKAGASVERVLARIRVENEISQKTFAKAGFRRHGGVRPLPSPHVVLLWRPGD